jgi:hypothetical protein
MPFPEKMEPKLASPDPPSVIMKAEDHVGRRRSERTATSAAARARDRQVAPDGVIVTFVPPREVRLSRRPLTDRTTWPLASRGVGPRSAGKTRIVRDGCKSRSASARKEAMSIDEPEGVIEIPFPGQA